LPVIIDFGIAKATSNQRLTDNTLFTAFEMLIGTPAYMSPEQAALASADASDDSDDVQPTIRRERADQRVPFKWHVDSADEEVEAAGELLDRDGISRRDDMVRPETLRFVEFALA